MGKAISTQLVIKYHHLDTILSFSDISPLLSPEAVFSTFVAELSAAIRLIKELRALSNQASSTDERHQADELLDKVVQSTAAYYASIRAYADEGYHHYLPQELSEQPEIIPEDIRSKILFKEHWGPFVYELRAPVNALKGYLEIIQTFSPQLEEIKRQEFLATFDKILEGVLDLLALYQRHLDGEIDLLDRNPG